MPTVAEQQMEHIGETRGVSDCTHDLVQILAQRASDLWRYDQYIANADGHSQVRDFWLRLKQQDRENVDRLKRLLVEELQKERS
jgi:hypothetical protein